jgi:hypothetical protein
MEAPMTTVSLDERIKSAFLEGAKSEEVAPLIAEAEVAAIHAGEAADSARERALDPSISAQDVAAARRQMEDAAFRRDRMGSAAIKLRQRLTELRDQEEDHRRHMAYDKAKAERDMLAIELKEFYPTIAPQLANLVARIDANDREIERINTRARPKGAVDIASAEAVARQLRNFVDGTASIPRITTRLRLPAFEYDRLAPYSWPRH